MNFCVELHPVPLTVCGRSFAQIDRHVEDAPARTAHQLPHAVADMEVQTSHDPAQRPRVVVLHELVIWRYPQLGVPFAPGTEVEVTISPKRKNAAEFTEARQRVCSELRRLPPERTITDDAIQQEINDYRAGK